MLPDELEHQELVKVRIQQGARNGIQLPVVIVRAPGEINDHDLITLTEPRGDAAGIRGLHPRVVFPMFPALVKPRKCRSFESVI
jgi:hypothetical protein